MSGRDALSSVKHQLARPHVRQSTAAIVLLVTLAAFIEFFVSHPTYFRALGHISPWTIVWVLLLNMAMIVVLALIYEILLRLCGQRIGKRENFLLTAYSSLANFFGPLQSGPGVRAVYLKAKYQIRLRDYTLATLISLGLFAIFSALFLFVGTRPWWQTALVLVAVIGFSLAVIRMFMHRDKKPAESHFALRPKVLAVLIVLVFIQVCITIGWYYVELRAVDQHIHFSQAMSYAGAANFSLFVSITPDGVGIREAFLLFSQHIHHVPTKDIVSANIIDRAVYVVFLGLLFIVVLSLHVKDKLKLKNPKRAAPESGQ